MEKGPISNQSCMLQDTSGTIKCLLWEEWVDKVQDDETYLFTNMRVKRDNYTSEIFINTAKFGCKIEKAQPFNDVLPEVSPTLSDYITKQATVAIIGVKQVSKYYSCNACGKKVEEDGKVVKCDSCKVKQRITDESSYWYAHLFVKNVDTKEKFCLSVFKEQFLNIIQKSNIDLEFHKDEEELTEVLLDTANMVVT